MLYTSTPVEVINFSSSARKFRILAFIMSCRSYWLTATDLAAWLTSIWVRLMCSWWNQFIDSNNSIHLMWFRCRHVDDADVRQKDNKWISRKISKQDILKRLKSKRKSPRPLGSYAERRVTRTERGFFGVQLTPSRNDSIAFIVSAHLSTKIPRVITKF